MSESLQEDITTAVPAAPEGEADATPDLDEQSPPAPLLQVCHWCADPQAVDVDKVGCRQVVLAADDTDPAHCAGRIVVAPRSGEAQLERWLGAGAVRVHVGTPALRDVGLVARLAARHGVGRLGLWLPVRRMPVQWRFDRESNADFSCLTPDCPMPRWEILAGDEGSGVDVEVWLRGLPQAESLALMLAVPAGDSFDEDICARLAGRYANLFLSAGRDVPEMALEGYVRHSGVRRLVLAPSVDEAPLAVALAEAARQNELDRTRRALFEAAELRYS